MSDADWLWHAARPVRGLAPPTAPSAEIAPLARRHGVVLPLREALREAGRIDAPLEALYNEVLRANLARVGELACLIDAFARAGVVAWPLKGPAWSVLAWGRAELRQSADLDFLARDGHFAAAARVLQAEGYVDPGLAHVWAAAEAGVRRLPHEVPFAHPARGGHVDLHQTLLRDHAVVGLDADPRPPGFVEVAGRRVATLDPIDALIYTCAHAAGHAFARVAWVGDIGGLLHHAPVDGYAVRDRAEAVGALRQTRIGVGLAERFLGVPRPDGLGADPGSAALGAQLAASIVDQSLDQPGLMRALRQLRARDTWRDRARYLARLPGDLVWEDFATATLPPRAFPAYGALRAARLLRRALAAG